MPTQINMAALIKDIQRLSCAIVVLGDFNPSIFHPLWFSSNNLIASDLADAAELKIVHKEISAFSMDEMEIQVDGNRLLITTDNLPKHLQIRDLTLGTLSLLEHTPLKAMGLNLDIVYEVESDEIWHSIGNCLVPKQIWHGVINEPGMRQVSVQGKRGDCAANHILFRIQPGKSCQVKVAVNQHYELQSDDRTDGTAWHDEALRVLNEDWNSFVTYAQDSAQKVLESTQHSIN